MSKDIKPCEHCGFTKWKTVEKGRKWKCRNPKCGRIREVAHPKREE